MMKYIELKEKRKSQKCEEKEWANATGRLMVA